MPGQQQQMQTCTQLKTCQGLYPGISNQTCWLAKGCKFSSSSSSCSCQTSCPCCCSAVLQVQEAGAHCPRLHQPGLLSGAQNLPALRQRQVCCCRSGRLPQVLLHIVLVSSYLMILSCPVSHPCSFGQPCVQNMVSKQLPDTKAFNASPHML